MSHDAQIVVLLGLGFALMQAVFLLILAGTVFCAAWERIGFMPALRELAGLMKSMRR